MTPDELRRTAGELSALFNGLAVKEAALGRSTDWVRSAARLSRELERIAVLDAADPADVEELGRQYRAELRWCKGTPFLRFSDCLHALEQRHRCPTCNYDLRATPDRCPECGTVPPPPLSPSPANG